MRLPLLAALLLGLAPVLHAQTGAPDPTFGTGGRVVLDPSGTLESEMAGVAVLPDGRILLAGRIGPDAAVIRLTAAGALDPTFGEGGVRTVDLGGPTGDAFADLVLLSDGAVLVAGAATDDDVPVGAVVVRLTPDGNLDPAFGAGGEVDEGDRGVTVFTSIAVRPDGRIVAVGQTEDIKGDTRFAAVGYLPDGSPDLGFGAGGLSVPEGEVLLGGSPALALDAAGRVVVAGIVGGPGGFFDTQIVTSRLLANGALDPSFGTGGSVVADFGPSFDISLDVVVDAAGRATVGGGVLDLSAGEADLLLLRYTAAGAPEQSFGTGGVVQTGEFGPAAIAFSLALQADGKLLVGGTAGTGESGNFLLARYSDAGVLDAAFGTGGRTIIDLGDNDVARALAFGSDGRVVLAGQTGNVDGTATSIAVARFVTDGRPVAGDAPPAGADVFALAAAPNPFGSQTAVTLALAEAGPVRIAVYDALGRAAAVLHDGPLAAGERTFRVDGAGLAPGLYVVRAAGAGVGASVRIVRH